LVVNFLKDSIMRYLPASEADIRKMLDAAGVGKMEDLFASIPEGLKLTKPLDLPPALSEPALMERFVSRSWKNSSATCRPLFLGAGAYNHYCPSPVNHILLRSEFYTSYTPYQPEMAQGTLQVIFEFQTMMADLTGMDVCNASLYDGASATAEAALMAHRVHKGKKVLVARSLHPAYREVLRTYLRHLDLDVEEVPFGADGRLDLDALGKALSPDVCVLLVGQPNFFGVVEDFRAIATALPAGPKKPLLAAMVSEALSLAMLEPPGALGADIVAGEARSFGLSLGYGGPYLGFLATKQAHMRQVPGRFCGETVDADGKRGFVLTLTTREQHIRREKATSNICTNEGLCMLAATVYLALMGRKNLRDLAEQNLAKAQYLRASVANRGVDPLFSGPTFNEFAVKLGVEPSFAHDKLFASNILGGYDLTRDYPELSGGYLLCATEMVSKDACDRLALLLGGL
jgi:glycine dehydrogenase subunit 1